MGYSSRLTLFCVGLAVAAASCGKSSGGHTGSAPNPPDAPAGLVATPGNASVDLTWDPVSGATSYNVYRDTTSPVTPGPVTLVASGVIPPSRKDSGLTNGTTYTYVVTAVNTGGESPPSLEVSATPATYFVDGVSGSDGNPGTFQAPFRTITFALGVVQSGEAIQVFPATYDAAHGEIFPMQLAPGVQVTGDEANRGAGANPVEISGMGVVGSTGYLATVLGADGVRLAGFTLGDSTYTVSHFSLYVAGATMTVSSNTFVGPAYGGVYLESAGTSVVEENEFDTGSYGVYVSNCPNAPIVRDNVFLAMAIPINVMGTTTNAIVDANRITGNGQVGIQVQHGASQILNNVFDLASGYQYGAFYTAFASATPIVRGNQFQCDSGVVINDGAPDLGTAADPGNNDFTAVSGASITHNAATTVSALGNTFPNNPPVLGVDIVITAGGTVLY